MKEIDKWIYLNEIDCLKFYAKEKYVVEIGAYKGFSTTLMAPVASYLISIDTFKSSNIPNVQGISTLEDYKKNTSHFRNIRVVIGDSHDPEIIKEISSYIQFLFIDGDHSYEGCLADLKNYAPKVEFDGVIGLHDYSLLYPGVIAACANYFGRRPDEIHHSLAIYKLINQSNKNRTDYYVDEEIDKKTERKIEKYRFGSKDMSFF